MYIKKQRLLTPGPTPLYPPALHAMMRSDMHHRTEDFRKVYRACLADLKEVMGTSNDVLMFAASGTGAMDAAVSNLFSKGDKVIVCVAGKFGERWADIVKAYGLDANVITVPYGQVVKPEQVEAALKAEPATKGVFVQASETSTGAAHDVEAMGRAIAKTDAIFVVDAITGLGTMPLDIDGWGLDVVIGGSQKAFMIPPGLAFMSISPKAWKLGETSQPAALLLQPEEGKEERRCGRIQLDAGHGDDPGAGRSLEIRQADRHGGADRERADAGAGHAGRGRKLGLELFSAASPGSSVTAITAPAGMDSGVIVKEFRNRFGSIIANGQGSMKGQIFRIAHLGYFDFADLFAMIAGLEIILNANGHTVHTVAASPRAGSLRRQCARSEGGASK